MELSRRNFVKFGLGVAAGTLLTPLPWKLLDDIAIWTQNWSWVPTPLRGKVSTINSVCTLCSGACGISVRKVGDRVVRVEGRDFPVNHGSVCPLGLAGPQLLYNEAIRWKAPMKKVSGKWQEVSWDEALNMLASRIKASPGKLVAIDGNQSMSTMAALVRRFLDAVDSRNYVTMPREEDTHAAVSSLMMGSDLVAFDLENSDFILSFGCGLLDGWGSSRMLSIWSRNNPYLVQVEPRLSNTASKADNWLAAFPGTEAALAFGIAHVLIKENLYDKDFVNSTSGFAAYANVVESYSPQAVEKITGVSKDAIVDVARSFSSAKSPVALVGQGKGNMLGNLQSFMAVYALNALVGNVNKKGGILAYDSDNIKAKGLLEFMDSDSSCVDTLLVFSANPVYTVPSCEDFAKALAKIPFVVSFSPFKDETSLMADLVLPDHTHLEKMADIMQPAGLQCYTLSKPAVQPLYNTMHSGDFVTALAKKLGIPFQSSFEDALKERAKLLSISWEDVKESGYAKLSGKLSGKKFSFAEVKHVSFPSVNGLVLCPVELINIASGWIANPPFLNKTLFEHQLRKGELFVELNPETASELGLKESSRAVLKTLHGELKVRVHLFDGAMPGVVFIPFGLGHTAYDSYLKGKGVNPNEVLESWHTKVELREVV